MASCFLSGIHDPRCELSPNISCRRQPSANDIGDPRPLRPHSRETTGTTATTETCVLNKLHRVPLTGFLRASLFAPEGTNATPVNVPSRDYLNLLGIYLIQQPKCLGHSPQPRCREPRLAQDLYIQSFKSQPLDSNHAPRPQNCRSVGKTNRSLTLSLLFPFPFTTILNRSTILLCPVATAKQTCRSTYQNRREGIAQGCVPSAGWRELGCHPLPCMLPLWQHVLISLSKIGNHGLPSAQPQPDVQYLCSPTAIYQAVVARMFVKPPANASQNSSCGTSCDYIARSNRFSFLTLLGTKIVSQ